MSSFRQREGFVSSTPTVLRHSFGELERRALLGTLKLGAFDTSTQEGISQRGTILIGRLVAREGGGGGRSFGEFATPEPAA